MKISAQKGFTLVEVLIVVSIIAILTGSLLPGFSSYIDTQNIKQAREQVKSDLRTMQNRALTGVDSSTGIQYWGLKIDSDNARQYYYFSSTANTQDACNAAATTESSTLLPGTVVIRNGVDAANKVCVFFDLNDGDANVVGRTLPVIALGYPDGDAVSCSALAINSGGLIQEFTEDPTTCEEE